MPNTSLRVVGIVGALDGIVAILKAIVFDATRWPDRTNMDRRCGPPMRGLGILLLGIAADLEVIVEEFKEEHGFNG